MNLFKLILLVKGYPIFRAIKKLSKLKSNEANEFEISIETALKNQFIFLKKNNSLFKKINGSNLIYNNSPIIQKSNIQRDLSEILSKGYTKHNTFSNSTSGSSGIPFKFAKDKFSHAMTWALIFDRYGWYGIEYGKSLQARFYGIPLKGISYYKERLKDYFAKRVRFPVFDLSDEKLSDYIEIFKKKKIEYINGYTSSIVLFARYCIARKVKLNEICPTLKVCIPTSEMCTPEDRRILEQGFGVRVAIEYGCAEMDILAFENPDGHFILSNENVFFEVVDENGNILEDGLEGRLILTSLYNKAIPLYRYEIGDIGAISKRKIGAYQILEKLSGRTNEFAVLANGRKIPALTFYYITKTLINDLSDVKEIIVHQINPDTFRFVYVSNFELDNNTKEVVRIALNNYVGNGLKAEFQKKMNIERTQAGKLRQFERLFDLMEIDA